MQNQFQTTFAPFVGSSKFDLSHEVKFSCKFGQLLPVMITDVLPGDHFQLNTEVIARFQALIAPMMHRVNLYTYSFFVPNRLIWENWKYWITETDYPDQNGDLRTPTQPIITIDQHNWGWFKKGTLADYMGIPTVDKAPIQKLDISILPFRAYQLIYNDYFRNQDVEPDLKYTTFSTTDVPTQKELENIYTIQYKNWEKDYFTSSFTEPQSGPEVKIPIDIQGTLAYVKGVQPLRDPSTGNLIGNMSNVLGTGRRTGSNVTELKYGQVSTNVDLGGEQIGEFNGVQQVNLDVSQTLSLTGVTNTSTIADLLLARTLQNFLSLAKRGGERYIEYLKSFFNVVSSDARLQRPQFLGGGKTPLVVSEVVQTSQTTDSAALGDYAGRMVALGSKHGFKSHFFEEHGFVITLMTIIPRSSYQQGIERFWTRDDRLDYYWPQFAHLQEQPVYNKELFVNYDNLGHDPDHPTDNPVDNDGIFGYQARYMEYRQKYSRVAGEFRDTLSFWHLGRIFTNPPVLNKSFCSTRGSSDTFTRPFAIQDGSDYVYVQMYHDLQAIRKMPKYVYPKF